MFYYFRFKPHTNVLNISTAIGHYQFNLTKTGKVDQVVSNFYNCIGIIILFFAL